MIKLSTLLFFLFFSLNADAFNSCNYPSEADSYVLALSSQPGFCETYGFEAGKPECRRLAKDSYAAKHLTLHGLWPNKERCGQHYGFCTSRPEANHCDYAPVNLSSDVSILLKKLMPSYSSGSCLERHEWNKHGSCQSLSENDYFALAMRLLTQTDESAFGVFLTEHQGERVKLSVLEERIAQSFGAKNVGKVYLGCKNGILVDIFIQLPALIPLNESLQSLINKAQGNTQRSLCPQNVILSHFNNALFFDNKRTS